LLIFEFLVSLEDWMIPEAEDLKNKVENKTDSRKKKK